MSVVIAVWRREKAFSIDMVLAQAWCGGVVKDLPQSFSLLLGLPCCQIVGILLCFSIYVARVLGYQLGILLVLYNG